MNGWRDSNPDSGCCCLLSRTNWSTVGRHPTSQHRLQMSGNPSLSLGWIPGVLSWNKLTPKPQRSFYFPLLFIGLVSGDNHLTLQNNCFVGMRASMLPAGKKAVAVIQRLILKTVKCSKVNITKGDLRLISNHSNWVGQVSTLLFGYQGPPLL